MTWQKCIRQAEADIGRSQDSCDSLAALHWHDSSTYCKNLPFVWPRLQRGPIVSSDIIGNPHSSIFVADWTQVIGDNLLKVVRDQGANRQRAGCSRRYVIRR